MPDQNTTTPAATGETPAAGQAQTPPQAPAEPLPFDKWFESQPEEVKGYFEDQTRALKSALESERNSRKALEKQLRDEAKKLEKGSDERNRLEELAGKLSAAQKQATFYDAAHKAGVTNLRLAFLAATDAGLVEDNGEVDFEALKASHPQLFGSGQPIKPPQANAGAGTGRPPASPVNMNELIRRAAGYR